jgi:hypothetical protein
VCEAEERAAKGSGLNCCCCGGLARVLDGLEDGFGEAKPERALKADG